MVAPLVKEAKRRTKSSEMIFLYIVFALKIKRYVVLEKFRKGDVPDVGSKEAEALFWARRGGKK